MNSILAKFDPSQDFEFRQHLTEATPLVGEVSNVRVEPGPASLTLEGLVGGVQSHQAKIKWFKDGSRIVFLDDCTCAQGGGCVHCLALILAAKENPPREEPPPAALPAAVARWLKEYQTATTAQKDPFALPATAKSFLAYIFQWGNDHRNAIVRLMNASRKGDDNTHLTHFDLRRISPNSHLSPGDMEIVEALRLDRYDLAAEARRLGSVIPKMIASGRSYFEKATDHALTMGGEIQVDLSWKTSQSGTQFPTLFCAGKTIVPTFSTPVFALDLEHGTVHPVKADVGDAAVSAWLSAPALSPSDAEILTRHLAAAPVPPPVPLPRSIKQTTAKNETPMPVLRLSVVEIPEDDYGRHLVLPEDVRMATLHLIYPSLPDQPFAFNVPPYSTSILKENGEVFSLTRNVRAESARYQELLTQTRLCDLLEALDLDGTDELEDALTMPMDSLEQWGEFFAEDVPRLEKLGWRIEVSDDFDAVPLIPDAWYDDLESMGMEWFEADLGIEVQGKRIPLLPALAAWMQRDGKRYTLEQLEQLGEKCLHIPLAEEGTSVPFPANRLHRILSSLTELFSLGPKSLQDGKLRLHPLRAAQLADEAGFASTNDDLRKLSARLRDFSTAPPPDIPKGLTAEMRPYQLEGFRWLQFLAAGHLGGILADDMGLGKTLQTLASILADKNAGIADRPTLIVAPKSVLHNWAIEAAKFTPGLRTVIYAGKERSKSAGTFEKFDLVITSYPILTRDEAHFISQEFHWVVLDEAQNIKNPRAKTTLAACALRSRGRLCLTGTPMENHLGELWSLFHFLMPGFLGSQDVFNKVFRHAIEKRGDNVQRQILARRIAPVMLRRTKTQVLTELPDKVESVRQIELSPAQKDLYESVRAVMDKKVREEIKKRGAERSQIMILDALLKLRQVCCHPQLLKIASARSVEESAKLEALMEMVPQLVEEGRRILLFSQFTEMLDIISTSLDTAGIPHFTLTGQTENRQSLVDKFQKQEKPVFLISLKAGGSGLNLTAADTVIHYDPWWNPAAENQATDRAHRFGQQKTVFVYKLICQNSIEEKILQLQQKKAELVASLLEGSGTSIKISEADISFLLAPLGE